MMLGIDNSAEGSPAVGLALYCVVQMVCWQPCWPMHALAPAPERDTVLAAHGGRWRPLHLCRFTLWPMCTRMSCFPRLC